MYLDLTEHNKSKIYDHIKTNTYQNIFNVFQV